MRGLSSITLEQWHRQAKKPISLHMHWLTRETLSSSLESSASFPMHLPSGDKWARTPSPPIHSQTWTIWYYGKRSMWPYDQKITIMNLCKGAQWRLYRLTLTLPWSKVNSVYLQVQACTLHLFSTYFLKHQLKRQTLQQVPLYWQQHKSLAGLKPLDPRHRSLPLGLTNRQQYAVIP